MGCPSPQSLKKNLRPVLGGDRAHGMSSFAPRTVGRGERGHLDGIVNRGRAEQERRGSGVGRERERKGRRLEFAVGRYESSRRALDMRRRRRGDETSRTTVVTRRMLWLLASNDRVTPSSFEESTASDGDRRQKPHRRRHVKSSRPRTKGARRLTKTLPRPDGASTPTEHRRQSKTRLHLERSALRGTAMVRRRMALSRATLVSVPDRGAGGRIRQNPGKFCGSRSGTALALVAGHPCSPQRSAPPSLASRLTSSASRSPHAAALLTSSWWAWPRPPSARVAYGSRAPWRTWRCISPSARSWSTSPPPT